MTVRRDEAWLVDFDEPVGREQAGLWPAVVVPSDALNEGPAGALVVVPLTSARRDLPSHIEIDDERSGLDEISYANLKTSSWSRSVVSSIGWEKWKAR